MDTVGERLIYARKMKKYTQNSLAEAIGVSRGVINNLESGKTKPQPIFINAICQEMCIRKDWLLNGNGEMDDVSPDAQCRNILGELRAVASTLSIDEQLFLLDTVKALKKRLAGKAIEPGG